MAVLRMQACGLVGLVSAWGYPPLVALMLLAAAGAPLPVAAALIALGAASAGPEGPPFHILALLGTAAAVAGDLADYGLGRIGVSALPGRMPRLAAWAHRVGARSVQRIRHARGPMIFLSRFLLTALGPPMSILAGISRLPIGVFVAWDLAGETIFVVGNLALGRWLGTAKSVPSLRFGALLGAIALVTAAPLLIRLIWLIRRELGHSMPVIRRHRDRRVGIGRDR
ncbi:MAG TPA: hypothetical protein VGS80_14145 [Ktedonobacterales bacterium]|nr:hypothetical protein [Ktedonobacterales bacterium]